jgi:hypothetical protein
MNEAAQLRQPRFAYMCLQVIKTGTRSAIVMPNYEIYLIIN